MLREPFELSPSDLTTNPLFCKEVSPSSVLPFYRVDPQPGNVAIWTDASYSSQDLNGGTAELIWTESFDTALTLIASAEGNVFSSTQVEMIAIQHALENVAPHLSGRKLFLFSDTLSALTYFFTAYSKTALSDTKNRLMWAYRKACQPVQIIVVYVPEHSGIWQIEVADSHAKNVLRNSNTVQFNTILSEAASFSRVFRSNPPAMRFSQKFPGDDDGSE